MNFFDTSLGLATRFHGFTRGLCGVIGKYTAEHRWSHPLIGVICWRLLLRAKRFAAVVARFEAGTLPPPRGEAHEQATPEPAKLEAAPRPRTPDPVPRRRGYLLKLGKHEAAYYMGVLERLVADPDMKALLEASPQARRLIRPLWLMLNPRPLPDILRLPPRRPASSSQGSVSDGQAARPASSHASHASPGSVDAPRVRVRAVSRSRRGRSFPA